MSIKVSDLELFDMCNFLRVGKKKRVKAPSFINTATFYTDHTVKSCYFKHFNV